MILTQFSVKKEQKNKKEIDEAVVKRQTEADTLVSMRVQNSDLTVDAYFMDLDHIYKNALTNEPVQLTREQLTLTMMEGIQDVVLKNGHQTKGKLHSYWAWTVPSVPEGSHAEWEWRLHGQVLMEELTATPPASPIHINVKVDAQKRAFEVVVDLLRAESDGLDVPAELQYALSLDYEKISEKISFKPGLFAL